MSTEAKIIELAERTGRLVEFAFGDRFMRKEMDSMVASRILNPREAMEVLLNRTKKANAFRLYRAENPGAGRRATILGGGRIFGRKMKMPSSKISPSLSQWDRAAGSATRLLKRVYGR